jgi:RNA-directed DNA polymerase
MSRWPSFHFRAQSGHLPEESTQAALNAAHRSQDRGLPAILTLKHLAGHARVEYRYLRELVERKRDPYRSFQVRKRQGGFRTIVVPEIPLMRTQRWIARFVLNRLSPHSASFAYQPGRSIVDCAHNHVGAKWLIKVDVRQFFESISEIQAWRIFTDCGYGDLISFEMARLVTRELPNASKRRIQPQWRANSSNRYSIPWYRNQWLGYLPQGAPTSPMLSNLAMAGFDTDVKVIADENGLTYTRYSDDLIFSTPGYFSRDKAVIVIRKVYGRMNREGLRPHQSKSVISPPGARKIVLGLLVDGERPRLRREFRRMLECHVHFLRLRGSVAHARARGFSSVLGLHRYLDGLLSFASAVDPEYVATLREVMENIEWPS